MSLMQRDYDKYLKTMDYIRRVKYQHQQYAKEYFKHKDPAIFIKMLKESWGDSSIPTFLYEEAVGKTDTNKRLLLASLIAERLLIKMNTGKLKHMSIALVGMAGSGKTTYAIRSCMGALEIAGYDKRYIVDMVSRLVFFEPNSLLFTVKKLLIEKKWIPCMIIDDIGGQISKYWVFLGQRYWSYLFSILDQLKDIVGVLITTARRYTSIPARIREITDIIGDFKEIDIKSNIVDKIEYYLEEDYKKTGRNRKPLFIDAIPPTAKMPDEMWKMMMEVRRQTGIKRIDKIIKMMEDAEEKMYQIQEAKEENVEEVEEDEE